MSQFISAFLTSSVAPARITQKRRQKGCSVSVEAMEVRLFLAGADDPNVQTPPTVTLTPPTIVITGTSITITPITVTVTAPNPQQTLQQTWGQSSAEYSTLKQEVEDRINNWSEQQNGLITDSFDNAEAALNQLIDCLSENPENLRAFANNSVNIVWAGGSYSGL